jgi:hypothetical protein
MRNQSTIHKRIRKLLDKGKTVCSTAFGRSGAIVSVVNSSSHPQDSLNVVYVRPFGKTNRTRSRPTYFNSGDPVVIRKRKNPGGLGFDYEVSHPADVWRKVWK